MVGRTVSHYEILEKLGEGGMGVVYKARDTHLDRYVALKVLPPERVADPGRRLRFVQEAKAASALNHPNIVTIYDIDSAEGVHFIAMEYVVGQTLDRVIGRKGMPVKQAVDCAVQVADALGKAHAAGIIHRDVKPSNIIVTPDGGVKILDFGLAKLVERAADFDEATTRTTVQPPVTEEGQIVGTIAYMSPEQATGGRLDARSDIFSFGVVLYEMVTGRRPFGGETGASTLEAVLAREPIPPSDIAGALPFELERAVLRCLRKDPQRRWQTMADLKVALQDLKDDLDSGKVSQVAVAAARRPPHRRRVVVGAAALVLVLAASAVAWWFLRPASAPSPSPASFEMEKLTFEGGAAFSPAISPDGRLLAYASDRDGRFSLYVRQLGARQAIRLTEHESNDWYPCFSPDGLKIVYRSERDGGGLYIIDALGGPGAAERKVADGGQVPSFSPGGATIAYLMPEYLGGRAKLFLVPAAGGAPRPFQPDFAVTVTAGIYVPPLWSPGGENIFFNGRRVGRSGTQGWWIAPAAGGEAVAVKDVPPEVRWAPRLVFAWRGDYIYYAEGEPVGGSSVYRARLTPRPWRIAGAPEKLASPAGVQVGGSISTQGLMVFAPLSPATNIWSASLTADGIVTGRLEPLTADSTGKGHLSVDANGSRLAYAALLGVPGRRNAEVRIRDLATGRETPIAATGGWPYLEPVLSRDGSKVAYLDMLEEKVVSYVAEAGATSGRAVCEDCAVSAFFANPAEALVEMGNQLVRRRLDGGGQVTLAEVPLREDVALSPNGNWLALTQARENGTVALYLADITRPPAPPGSWKLVVEDRKYLGSPAWTPDGKRLYYVSERDGFPCVWVQPIGSNGAPAGPAVAALHLHPGSGIFARYNNITATNDRLFVLLTEVKAEVYSIKLDR